MRKDQEEEEMPLSQVHSQNEVTKAMFIQRTRRYDVSVDGLCESKVVNKNLISGFV